jgi:hypothetical protein
MQCEEGTGKMPNPWSEEEEEDIWQWFSSRNP